jgi:hypothetical protein
MSIEAKQSAAVEEFRNEYTKFAKLLAQTGLNPEPEIRARLKESLDTVAAYEKDSLQMCTNGANIYFDEKEGWFSQTFQDNLATFKGVVDATATQFANVAEAFKGFHKACQTAVDHPETFKPTGCGGGGAKKPSGNKVAPEEATKEAALFGKVDAILKGSIAQMEAVVESGQAITAAVGGAMGKCQATGVEVRDTHSAVSAMYNELVTILEASGYSEEDFLFPIVGKSADMGPLLEAANNANLDTIAFEQVFLREGKGAELRHADRQHGQDRHR